MKTVKVLALTASLIFLFTERVIAQTNSGARVVRGELVYVLCGTDIRVRDQSLDRVLFSSDAYERISPYQGWGETKKTIERDGQTITFKKVEFLNGQEKIGWVSEEFIKLKADCPRAEVPQISTADDSLNNITGLNDPKCCFFPLEKEPSASYTTGARRFGADRFNTLTRTHRAHAGVDLYTGLNNKVRAIAPGTVLYSPRHFYMETYEVAVRHPGGFIARYGEISKYPRQQVRGIEKNVRIRTGQHLGHVGRVYSKKKKRYVAPPMLHLELYKGTIRGDGLTQPGRKPYERRADVIDPTKHVLRWEQLTL